MPGSNRPRQATGGDYATAIQAARAFADDLLAKTRKQQRPDAAAIVLYTVNAWHNACAIASMSRQPDSLPLRQFVEAQTRLEECFKRADKLATPDALAKLPTTPGATFGMKAADSALVTALLFARGIVAATGYARSRTVGNVGHYPPELRIDGDAPDPKLIAWRDAAIVELREHTLPALPAWPLYEIHRDAQRLESWLRDEHRRAMGVRQAGERRKGTPVATAKKLAEAHCARNPFPGVKALAKIVGCSPSTMSDAIDESAKLRAMRVEHEAQRKSVSAVAMTEAAAASAKQTREADPIDLASASTDKLTRWLMGQAKTEAERAKLKAKTPAELRELVATVAYDPDAHGPDESPRVRGRSR